MLIVTDIKELQVVLFYYLNNYLFIYNFILFINLNIFNIIIFYFHKYLII